MAARGLPCPLKLKTNAAKRRSRIWVHTAAAAVAARIDEKSVCPNSAATRPAAAPVSERLEAYRTHRVNGRVSSPSIDETETAIAPIGPHRTAARRIGKSEIETLCAPVTSI